MKARNEREVKKFTDIPNVGEAMTRDFISMGLREPKDLMRKDPFRLYKKMCAQSGGRQDPCVLDTYMAVIDFMNGAPARPWWFYTKIRKKEYPNI
jgi:hypothetical protein